MVCRCAKLLRMTFSRILLAGACTLSLISCSDSDSGSSDGADPTTTTVAITGLCRVITAEHLDALFGPGYAFGQPDDTETTCNWSIENTEGGARGRIHLGGSGIPYEKTIEDATTLGYSITDVEGLGAKAHFTANEAEQEYWITIENGTGVVSVLAGYRNGAVPPTEADLIAALSALATEYLPVI